MSALNLPATIEAYNVLFFDFDGTLIDTDLANFLAYKKALQLVLSSEINIYYDATQRFTSQSLNAIYPPIEQELKIQIIHEKEKIFPEYLNTTTINKPILNLIRDCTNNLKFLVTNGKKNRVIATLHYHGLHDLFNGIFYPQMEGHTVVANKFQVSINHLKIDPASIIVFEDSHSDINDAVLSGIPKYNIWRVK